MDFISIVSILVIAFFAGRYIAGSVTRSLHKPLIAIAALFSWSLAMPAAAQPTPGQPRAVALNWVITNVKASGGRFRLMKRGGSPIASAQPTDLVTVDGPVIREKGKSAIPAATVFSRSMIGKGVICEPGRRIGQGSIACLADTDGDGRFDQVSAVQAKSYSYNSVQNIGYLVGEMTTGRWVALAQPVTASAVRADTPIETMDVRIILISFGALPAQSASFSVCAQRNEGRTIWGGPIHMDYCRGSINFAPGASPPERSLIAKATITLHAVDELGAEVSISGLNVGDALYGPY
jgi:hypothetical protein